MLAERGKLLRCFTQNIDSLESSAGLSSEMIVAAHGNFDRAHVVGSGRDVPVEEVRAAAFGGPDDWSALEARHGGRVKPSIVFFGENLPRRFFERAAADLPQCTLLLVLGTSLAVQPFAGLVHQVPPGTPRLLVNRERVGPWAHAAYATGGGGGGGAFAREEAGWKEDRFFEGDCDDAVWQLCALLGWEAQLQAVLDAAPKGAAAAKI